MYIPRDKYAILAQILCNAIELANRPDSEKHKSNQYYEGITSVLYAAEHLCRFSQRQIFGGQSKHITIDSGQGGSGRESISNIPVYDFLEVRRRTRFEQWEKGVYTRGTGEGKHFHASSCLTHLSFWFLAHPWVAAGLVSPWPSVAFVRQIRLCPASASRLPPTRTSPLHREVPAESPPTNTEGLPPPLCRIGSRSTPMVQSTVFTPPLHLARPQHDRPPTLLVNPANNAMLSLSPFVPCQKSDRASLCQISMLLGWTATVEGPEDFTNRLQYGLFSNLACKGTVRFRSRFTRA
ncbi:hypothetical protein B0H11DRAFT_2307167 [Mycena galericulata]|nr:hypothetical protein B0H11DRAFT_2307167 [Mycena galericulata]